MDLAAAFLLSRQDPDSLWRDFETLAGESTDWVTGYVAAQLSRYPAHRACVEAAATTLLSHQHPDGGWGYHTGVPTDADSTAYVMLFLHTLWPDHPAIADAANCLKTHQSVSGGVATYATPDPIRNFMQLPPDIPITGWCRPHVSVTAAAGLAWAKLGNHWRQSAESAWDYLQQHQHPSGYWQSYWWVSPHYPTYLATALALTLDPVRKQHPSVRRILYWLKSSQLSDGGWAFQVGQPSNDFASALAVATLALAEPNSDAQQRGIQYLRRRQQPDGSWLSRPMLMIPPPHISEPQTIHRWRYNALGTGVIIRDQHRLYTTATCFLALAQE